MRRSCRSTVRLHQHCEGCYSRRCRAPVEVSVSCVTISCRLLCGAVFHLCKEEEHQLLCPNVKVPCLNAHYGCPFTMCRSKLAKHLEVCPASVVSCSLEWNRWPIEETNTVFYDNVIKEPYSEEQLDLSMALRDQKLLCERLKMKSFFPELMEEVEELPPPEPEEAAESEAIENGAAWAPTARGGGERSGHNFTGAEMPELTQDKKKNTVDTESYNQWEKMFSMERGGCKQAAKALKDKKQGDGKEEKASPSPGSQKTEKEGPKESQAAATAMPVDISKTGLAPWQDGVLERLGKEVNVKDFNMYLVHHGRMLIRFGQMPACTPREKDFVYGSLEPIPVQTLRSFKVPTSYREKRIHLRDPTTRACTEDKCVDTSDLGVSMEDIPKMDEIPATLLCSSEKELRGHKVCETVVTDGLFVDLATQTYDFHTAPFKRNASLADITADRALKLHVQIHAESVTSRHNKASSAFTFLCSHFFRRDEFRSHFKNVHSDIQSCLNGWFEQRCPLAYLGCTYSQKRFQPSTHRAKVSYNQDLSTFTLRPEVSASLFKGVKTIATERKRARNLDSLSRLPFEVLVHIAGFLDSFTLSQLALVSKLMRDVCATLLQERGMVSLKWEKKTYSHGRICWRPRQVWQFSNLFSTVERWCFGDTPSMAQHLKLCPFYQTEDKREPVALASVSDSKWNVRECQSLVALFRGHK
ncbi:F-box only protein 40-like [Megalops cyprinoides]|uniref:F-box only protein 40-like n=1 Tax=Megalops cyprinoides TaxID=118141 RepID=UPI00186483BC|nr:F-box only protein 40-like [Megalops cyprinoides]